MKLFKLTILSIFAILLFSFSLSAQTPAFPGAEGGGMYTTGGRGGMVLYVTKLTDDSSVGTLRWAINQSGKRTILFKVGGLITLNSELRINNGDLTIAGQTAPGDGICIKNYPVIIGNANNVIIRYIRFRLGDEIASTVVTDSEKKYWDGADAIWGRNRTNIILDHCSMSWSIDEVASFYSNQNFTMQWCYITEALNKSFHGKADHGYGGLWGGKNATFHHNLLAHNYSRNPRFNGWKRSGLSYENPWDEERMDFRNNVIYNWGGNSGYGGEAAGKYNVVANYYKPGSGSSNKGRIVNIDIDAGTTINPRYGSFYVAENIMYSNQNVTNDNWIGVTGNKSQPGARAEVPFEMTSINQQTAQVAYEKVLEFGGASLSRDAVDVRIANEVQTGTTTYKGSKTGFLGIIDSQTDVGGWPAYNSGVYPTDSNNDGIPDGWLEEHYPGKTATEMDEFGYTYLEIYLNGLVAHITESQGYVAPPVQEFVDLFCGTVPTDIPVTLPDELSDLITAGTLSTEDRAGKTDGCLSDNNFAWRTSDVTFTLPPNAVFSANIASNGTRFVKVTVDGVLYGSVYNLKNNSCEPIYLDLKNSENVTLRIESFSSADESAYSQFSIPSLCIRQVIPTSAKEVEAAKISQVSITRDNIFTDAHSIEIYNINGQLIRSQLNSTSLYIGDLKQGVYITQVILKDGSKENLKFVR